eukprot:TRINITY_DN58726_c0_g1_i4.p1 TRINITY_DN58726_c0_g1~~TRINITY_DN58726_c0_g1_i4.p1  ORF type:complete len:388 (-),score=103.99 TRINITY_DN58726_c0_g1_i4:248-1411(-)
MLAGAGALSWQQRSGRLSQRSFGGVGHCASVGVRATASGGEAGSARPGTRFDKELAIAVEAVTAAADVAKHVATTLSESMDEGKLNKADASPVTVADFGVQAVVLRYLAQHFGEDEVCAEESAKELRESPALLDQVLAGVRVVCKDASEDDVCNWIDRGTLRDTAGQRRFWTLDPIDGTKGFLRREQYAVCLALIEDGRPVVAAMACPNLPGAEGDPGCVFYAAEGAGAWVNSMPGLGDAALLQLPAFDEAALPDLRFCQSVEKGHSSHDDAARVAKELSIGLPPLLMDSQAKYGVLCRNEAQVLLRLPGGLTGGTYRENMWDIACGALLLQEAGGGVCDIYGKELNFNTGHKLLENKGIVAATSAELLRRVVDAVARVRAAAAAKL